MFQYFTKGTRYYALELTTDLFNIVVVKHYGRIGTRQSQSRTMAFDDANSAQCYFDKEVSRRLHRGYALVTA